MTALILSTFTTHDGTTKARIKTDTGRIEVIPAPFGAAEGQRLKFISGEWRLQSRAA